MKYEKIYCNTSYMSSKKIFSTRIDEDSIRALKHLAVDTDKSLGELLGEAIRDLVRKYDPTRYQEAGRTTSYRAG